MALARSTVSHIAAIREGQAATPTGPESGWGRRAELLPSLGSAGPGGRARQVRAVESPQPPPGKAGGGNPDGSGGTSWREVAPGWSGRRRGFGNRCSGGGAMNAGRLFSLKKGLEQVPMGARFIVSPQSSQ